MIAGDGVADVEVFQHPVDEFHAPGVLVFLQEIVDVLFTENPTQQTGDGAAEVAEGTGEQLGKLDLQGLLHIDHRESEWG